MPHLPSERLAALIDEPPTPEEAAHLASCTDCAREPAAYALLDGLARAESGRTLPLTRWESIAAALEREQLITRGAARNASLFGGRRVWLEVAAAIILVAGGLLAGRSSAGVSPLSFMRHQVAMRDTGLIDQESSFRNVDDAVDAVNRSQAEYQSAVMFLAQHDTAGRAGNSPASVKRRLAALDQVRATMNQALRDAPSDPVINGFFLSALGQQAAARRQLITPVRLTSY